MIAFFLGPHASYTHSAAKLLSKDDDDLIPLPTILKVFEMVGMDSFGIVPLENSIFGSVSETFDALALFPDLEITSEALIEIDHCLATNRNHPISYIKKVISHPQALGQCSQWISEKLGDVQLVESSSTARAALDVSNSDSDGVAAICSKDCAEKYNLFVLEDSIQNFNTNMTRFVKIRLKNTNCTPKDKSIKTLISFTVNHDQPGELSLALLELNKVQLTRIDSRPNQKKHWEYIFYIEMIGDANDPHISTILRNIKKVTQSITIHGSFWLVNPRQG